MGQKPQSQQQRKKRVLEEVLRQRRRQRTVTLIVIGAVLVAIIAGGAYVLSTQHSTLPGNLDVCVSGYGNAYHAHAHLAISVNGGPQTIPPDVGRTSGCLRPLHTHATDGVIHIEPDQDGTFKLGDFFLIWNQPFNATQFMSYTYRAGQLTMTVNGTPNQSLQNYVFPRNAQFSTDACSAGSCQNVDIAITLNNS